MTTAHPWAMIRPGRLYHHRHNRSGARGRGRDRQPFRPHPRALTAQPIAGDHIAGNRTRTPRPCPATGANAPSRSERSAISASTPTSTRTATPAATAASLTSRRCASATARSSPSRTCGLGCVVRAAARALSRFSMFGMRGRTLELSLGFLERFPCAHQLRGDQVHPAQLRRGVELPLQLGDPRRPVFDICCGHAR
jgi:hypothetical protein